VFVIVLTQMIDHPLLQQKILPGICFAFCSNQRGLQWLDFFIFNANSDDLFQIIPCPSSLAALPSTDSESATIG
jgi:hypothetical protein